MLDPSDYITVRIMLVRSAFHLVTGPFLVPYLPVLIVSCTTCKIQRAENGLQAFTNLMVGHVVQRLRAPELAEDSSGTPLRIQHYCVTVLSYMAVCVMSRLTRELCAFPPTQLHLCPHRPICRLIAPFCNTSNIGL